MDTCVVIVLLENDPEYGLRSAQLLELRLFPDSRTVADLLQWLRTHRLGRKRLLDTLLAAAFRNAGIRRIITNNHGDYGISKADVLTGMGTLFARPTFLVHPAVLELLSQDGIASAKPGFLDRLIHAEYARFGTTLVTFEKSARRLSGVKWLGGKP